MISLKNLGRYKIESHLGTGAFADVYRAVDQTLDRAVALKVLKPTLVADGESFARFIREAKITANLIHSHIVTVWDMGETDGHYYLAMRYVDGKSLDRLLAEEGALPWPRAYAIISHVGGALDFAHKKGLVHRDVKPQNIIISAEEEEVLTDFGLVRAMASSGMTTTGSFLGAPAYMAPEIWEGEEATPASDQYALACVLAEMLTGKVLFGGNTPPAVMLLHFKPLELPQKWAADVPIFISDVLKKALNKENNQRYLSIHELVSKLSPIQQRSSARSSDPDTNSHLEESNLDNPAGIEWVQIPAGELLSGSKKVRRYVRKSYLIAKYPISNWQYKMFIDATPTLDVPKGWDKSTRNFPRGMENHPVVAMSARGITYFCAWSGLRLPAFDEWEKAARGTDGRTYPWGEDWVDGKYCNTEEARIGDTSTVDSYQEGISPYGVWDTCGNCTEVVKSSGRNGYVICSSSWFHSRHDSISAVCSYRGETCFSVKLEGLDSFWKFPILSQPWAGFRVARSL